MDANLVTIKANVAAVLQGIDGIVGASPSDLDSIPTTPWATVGDPKSTLEKQGQWEETEFLLPVTLFIAQTGIDPTRMDALILPFVWAVKAAFRTQVGLSDAVTQCVVDSWDASAYITVGRAPAQTVDYRAIIFQLRILVAGPATYTA